MAQKIQNYVRDHLFKHLKFFNLKSMLYNTKKGSVCQRFATALFVADSGRKTFWSTYSKCVERAVRYGRNNAVQAMKQSFLGGKFE